MRRRPTAPVAPDILDALFQEFDIWEKIRDGRLTTEIVPNTDRPSATWSNATSRILKHSIPGGNHVVTTHTVVDNSDEGIVYHWDAKDFKMHEVKLWSDKSLAPTSEHDAS